jgi:hypothetical protein
MHGGSIVDAMIREAPTSTKNSAKSRDPEMRQIQKCVRSRKGMSGILG